MIFWTDNFTKYRSLPFAASRLEISAMMYVNVKFSKCESEFCNVKCTSGFV